MKLKPEEKAEIVENLTTNCEAWSYENSDAVLNAMPDEQLISLAMNYDAQAEMASVLGGIQETFKLPSELALNQVPATLKQIVINAAGPAFDGRDPENKGEEEGEEEQDDDREGSDEGEMSEFEHDPDDAGEYAGDTGTKEIHQGQTHNKAKQPVAETRNQRRKPMTEKEYLAAAPPRIQSLIRNAMRHDEEVKGQLIETITANQNNPFSEDQLVRMTTEQLTPLAQLAQAPKKITRNTARKEVVDFFNEEPTADYRGAAAPVRNGHPVNNAEDGEDERGPLIPPTINWAENAKELNAAK